MYFVIFKFKLCRKQPSILTRCSKPVEKVRLRSTNRQFRAGEKGEKEERRQDHGVEGTELRTNEREGKNADCERS